MKIGKRLDFFGAGKFFHARERRPLQGAESNSPSGRTGFCLEARLVGLVLSLKFPMLLTNRVLFWYGRKTLLSQGLLLQIPFERRDKNKYIGEEIENE